MNYVVQGAQSSVLSEGQKLRTVTGVTLLLLGRRATFFGAGTGRHRRPASLVRRWTRLSEHFKGEQLRETCDDHAALLIYIHFNDTSAQRGCVNLMDESIKKYTLCVFSTRLLKLSSADTPAHLKPRSRLLFLILGSFCSYSY